RGTRSRVVRRVQSGRRRVLPPALRLCGAGLLLPGLLPLRLSGLLRSRRVRAEPTSGRIPVAAAVSGAGAAPAAAPDRRGVSPRTLRAAWRRDQNRVPVGVDPEAATSAAGRGPAATVPDHALAVGSTPPSAGSPLPPRSGDSEAAPARPRACGAGAPCRRARSGPARCAPVPTLRAAAAGA